MVHKIKKGLNLPLAGAPEQKIENADQPYSVALVADDYVGISPKMKISIGDEVRRGQVLFEDKKSPGVHYTSPASGKVTNIHRGERRTLKSVVIKLDSAELSGRPDCINFHSFSRKPGELYTSAAS